jgi:hypothetical protein
MNWVILGKRPWSNRGTISGFGEKCEKYFSQDIQCAGRDSNQAPTEHKSPRPACSLLSLSRASLNPHLSSNTAGNIGSVEGQYRMRIRQVSGPADPGVKVVEG